MTPSPTRSEDEHTIRPRFASGSELRNRAHSGFDSESRYGDRRIIHEAPLGLLYRVDVERMRVRILAVWTY